MTIAERLARIEDLIPTLDSVELMNKIDKLSEDVKGYSFKLDEMYNKYEPLLKTVLIEFDNHRRGISLILKGLGYPVDEIKGWDENNWETKDGRNSRKSKRILRRSRRKAKRGKKNV